jgi:hypothetical protein
MKKLLPIVLLLIGLGAGGGVGWVLQPAAEAAPAVPDAQAQGQGNGAAGQDQPAPPTDYRPAPENLETVRMPNQFVVPLIRDGQVYAMVVIGLALELEAGSGFTLADSEPRLRAIFLQVLFDHANLGGFDGVFTAGEALLSLRRTLREAARAEIGPDLYDILITELLRQES